MNSFGREYEDRKLLEAIIAVLQTHCSNRGKLIRILFFICRHKEALTMLTKAMQSRYDQIEEGLKDVNMLLGLSYEKLKENKLKKRDEYVIDRIFNFYRDNKNGVLPSSYQIEKELKAEREGVKDSK